MGCVHLAGYEGATINSLLVPLLVALVLCIGGLYLLALFARHLKLRLAMSRWPRTPGIVRGHRIHSHPNRHGAGHHRPIVTVECKSAGRKWRVDCDSPTRLGFAGKNTAQTILNTFPLGKSVEVYVDPKNPQRAFLGPPETAALLMLSLGSLFLLTVAVGILNGLSLLSLP